MLSTSGTTSREKIPLSKDRFGLTPTPISDQVLVTSTFFVAQFGLPSPVHLPHQSENICTWKVRVDRDVQLLFPLRQRSTLICRKSGVPVTPPLSVTLSHGSWLQPPAARARMQISARSAHSFWPREPARSL